MSNSNRSKRNSLLNRSYVTWIRIHQSGSQYKNQRKFWPESLTTKSKDRLIRWEMVLLRYFRLILGLAVDCNIIKIETGETIHAE